LQNAIVSVGKFCDDDASLEELYAHHRNFTYRVALRVMRNADDAEDVVQNVFLRMMKNGKRLDADCSATAYLRRAATNAAIDLIRKRNHRAETDLPAYHPAAEQSVMEKHYVRQVLDKLPSQHAEMFEMHYREGYAYEALAESFGVQVGTVKSRLHRIRAALQKELQAA
jgi:RNA polymerase sigma-70 factor (ECF subfamily)